MRVALDVWCGPTTTLCIERNPRVQVVRVAQHAEPDDVWIKDALMLGAEVIVSADKGIVKWVAGTPILVPPWACGGDELVRWACETLDGLAQASFYDLPGWVERANQWARAIGALNAETPILTPPSSRPRQTFASSNPDRNALISAGIIQPVR